MNTALVLALLLPLLGFLYCALIGWRMPVRTSGMIASAAVGLSLDSTYLVPFEVTSVLLLVAIVGAVTLARGTR